MKKYYTHNGAEQQGPFDVLDLKAKLIKKDTPIWYEGLKDWTTADNVDELKEIFSSPPSFTGKSSRQEPPNFNNESEFSNTPIYNIGYKLGKLATWIALAALIFIVCIFFWKQLENRQNSSSYEEKVMTIEEIERLTPTDFLSASGTYSENFWGTKYNISCTITNKATVASYKDAVVRVTYYSKTRTVLGNEDFTIYEVFAPHSSKEVKLKVSDYKNVDGLGWNVISAKSY